jgi:hypothetical protein
VLPLALEESRHPRLREHRDGCLEFRHVDRPIGARFISYTDFVSARSSPMSCLTRRGIAHKSSRLEPRNSIDQRIAPATLRRWITRS